MLSVFKTYKSRLGKAEWAWHKVVRSTYWKNIFSLSSLSLLLSSEQDFSEIPGQCWCHILWTTIVSLSLTGRAALYLSWCFQGLNVTTNLLSRFVQLGWFLYINSHIENQFMDLKASFTLFLMCLCCEKDLKTIHRHWFQLHVNSWLFWGMLLRK